jgi:uncharacterized protein with von Willebrand factor type A (vWA) domain
MKRIILFTIVLMFCIKLSAQESDYDGVLDFFVKKGLIETKKYHDEYLKRGFNENFSTLTQAQRDSFVATISAKYEIEKIERMMPSKEKEDSIAIINKKRLAIIDKIDKELWIDDGGAKPVYRSVNTPYDEIMIIHIYGSPVILNRDKKRICDKYKKILKENGFTLIFMSVIYPDEDLDNTITFQLKD